MDDGQLALPWVPSPTSWLFGSSEDWPELGPNLDLDLDLDLDLGLDLMGGNELPDDLLSFLEEGIKDEAIPNASAVSSVATASHAGVEGESVDTGLIDPDHVPAPLVEEGVMEMDGPGNGFPVAIPGWNVANFEEVGNESSASAWPTATQLADQLIQSVPAPSEGGSIHGRDESSSSGDGEVLEAVNFSSLTIRRDGANDIATGVSTNSVPYVPDVSTISDSTDTNSAFSETDRVLGPSRIQQHWSRLQARPQRMSASRVAMVRPRPRQASLLRRRRSQPHLWQIFSSSPILQAHSILSRVTDASGDTTIEELNSRFNMSRSVATQTITPVFADVQTGMSDDDRPRNVIVIRVGGVVGAMRRRELVENTPQIETPAVDPEVAVESGEPEGPMEVDNFGDSSGGEATVDSSEGTPLLDE
jgi:hypothetical protein